MKRTPSRPLLLGSVTLLLAAWVSMQPGNAAELMTDLKRLQGHWEGTGPGGTCSITISGNTLRFQAREDVWYETSFTLPTETNPPQLHATILKDNTGRDRDIGTVVVAVFKFGDGTLDLGVLGSFEEAPAEPVQGDWTTASDRYYLKKAQAPER